MAQSAPPSDAPSDDPSSDDPGLPPASAAASLSLHDWWQRKRGRRPMPSRDDLDPLELKPILRSILVIGVEHAEFGRTLTFSCRLAGTEVDSRLGISVTGMTLDEAPLGATRDSIRRQYEIAVRERRPVFCSHNMVVNGERYVEYDRMVVPLADEQGEVSTLVAAVDFRCAYPVEHGRPPDCMRPAYCDRIDLCLAATAACGSGRG
ncbi:MAG TPA: PAS domain-containing protein [Dongiaceae bacterium]|nr:PAS domain-containing protein [Dongiaceae bacterium]